MTAQRTRRPSLTDQLEAHFRAHPGELVLSTEIASIVGVSGARQRRLEVEQRGLYLERVEWHDHGRHFLAWRYLPLLQGPRSSSPVRGQEGQAA